MTSRATGENRPTWVCVARSAARWRGFVGREYGWQVQCSEHPAGLPKFCRVRFVAYGKTRARHGYFCGGCYRVCPVCAANAVRHLEDEEGDRMVFRRATGRLVAVTRETKREARKL